MASQIKEETKEGPVALNDKRFQLHIYWLDMAQENLRPSAYTGPELKVKR